MITRVAAFGTAVLVVAAWPAVSGQLPLRNTYVVTQAYCLKPQAPAPGKCYAQSLPITDTLEVQLPGTPSVWTVSSVPDSLKPLGSKKLPNPNRVAGTSEVYIFTFKAVNQGSVNLVFEETPPLLSSGTFTFQITVK